MKWLTGQTEATRLMAKNSSMGNNSTLSSMQETNFRPMDKSVYVCAQYGKLWSIQKRRLIQTHTGRLILVFFKIDFSTVQSRMVVKIVQWIRKNLTDKFSGYLITFLFSATSVIQRRIMVNTAREEKWSLLLWKQTYYLSARTGKTMEILLNGTDVNSGRPKDEAGVSTTKETFGRRWPSDVHNLWGGGTKRHLNRYSIRLRSQWLCSMESRNVILK